MRACLAALLLLVSSLVFARPEKGKDYLDIDPPVSHQGRELIEFFYYGCPECLDLEPFLKDWLASRPDVTLVRLPAFRDAWLPLARAYYSLQMLGEEKRLRGRIYSAMQNRGLDLDKESVLFEWLGWQGIDMKKFGRLYRSREVDMKIMDSKDLATRSGISGVPSLIVAGRYLVLGNLANGELLDALFEMAGQAK
ncbi:MAG TPA: thiol:disulfide interchange protein DsbA/DsbL [Burkholderiales bacterium]|nr:thiol:disulfide interchange protein DsbA/DsbL [Burkholderiales bacterium]